METLITYGDSHLSIGVLVGIPAMTLLIAACLLVSLWAVRREWSSYDGELRVGCKWGGIAVAAILTVGTLLALYPYQGEYHHWQNISGTVSTTNSRFVANGDGKGTSQKFVVTFEGFDQQFGCNDTRCATVRKGDDLTITCKRAFQWFGTPGYDCNFVSLKPGSAE